MSLWTNPWVQAENYMAHPKPSSPEVSRSEVSRSEVSGSEVSRFEVSGSEVSRHPLASVVSFVSMSGINTLTPDEVY